MTTKQSASQDAEKKVNNSQCMTTEQSRQQDEIRMEQMEQQQMDTTRITQPTETSQSASVNNPNYGNTINSQSRPSSSTLPQAPPAHKAVPKESHGTQRATTGNSGSAQRKRSRVLEEGGQGIPHQGTKINECITNMNVHIENLQRNGQKGATGTMRTQMYEIMKEITNETTNMLAKMVNLQDVQIYYMKAEKLMKDKMVVLQEENNNVKQQVIDLQMKILQKEQEEKTATPLSYVQAATKQVASNIINGRQMPIPQVAQGIKQAPSECIIIFKVGEKGEMASKQEQEKFRGKLREVLGDEEMRGVSVIRPTRFGGYTVILHNEQIRDKVFENLRNNETMKEIYNTETCMVAPIKRVAKVVCKEAPADISIEQIKKDMFGKHNPMLQTVNPANRTGKIYRTRLGLIFELSCQEMAAVQSQGWRIRCDLARELRVEEFISLQQCYACSKFGHSANECKSEDAVCRLCGKTGHAGKDCPDRDNKEHWKCANCMRMNLTKNLQLDVKHAAAQLHKCPVAQQQRNVRKIQLAATGVFTTPIQKNEDFLKEKQTEASERQRANGAQRTTMHYDFKRDNRSRSTRRYNEGNINDTRKQINERRENVRRFYEGREKNSVEENPCVQRTIKTSQSQSADGWRVVGKKEIKQNMSSGKESGSMKEEKTYLREEMDVEEELEELWRPYEEEMQIYDE